MNTLETCHRARAEPSPRLADRDDLGLIGVDRGLTRFAALKSRESG